MHPLAGHEARQKCSRPHGKQNAFRHPAHHPYGSVRATAHVTQTGSAGNAGSWSDKLFKGMIESNQNLNDNSAERMGR